LHHRIGLFPLIHAHVKERPRPPSALARQAISGALDLVVLRALAKFTFDNQAHAALPLSTLGNVPRTRDPDEADEADERAERAKATEVLRDESARLVGADSGKMTTTTLGSASATTSSSAHMKVG